MMTFQDFVQNPNIKSIDLDGGYIDFFPSDDVSSDATADTSKLGFDVNITLTIEQSLYIARVLSANNSGRLHDVKDFDILKIFNDANFKAITGFYDATPALSAPACHEH